jgi:hypothetical protein
MKRFLLIIFVAAGFAGQAQLYNNEWINFGSTYYKFRVQPTGTGVGVYRIQHDVLSANGLGSVPAEQFQLWRLGEEVPIYTSVATGPFSSTDYIEFRAELNNGKMDKDLYRNPAHQLNDKWSFQTDSLTYFLTVNTGTNKRLVPTNNDVAGNILPAEPFFMHTLGHYFSNKVNLGYAVPVGEYVYSSAYDQGEGFTSVDISPTGFVTTTYTDINLYTGPGAPQPTFNINAVGNAQNPRSFEVKINNNVILNQVMDYFDDIKVTMPINASVLSGNSATVVVTNKGIGTGDRMVVAMHEIIYPRQFNFSAARNFDFELPANTNGNYLEITNFNNNLVQPVLYDLTNGRRYVGNISDPTKIKFALLPSATARKLTLVAQDNSNIGIVQRMEARNFINFNLPANQGNYLLISNPVFTTGSNPLETYRAYRSSIAGGAYNAKIILIEDLVDQFAFGIKKHPLSIRNFLRFAKMNFAQPMKYVFLIGKGVAYNQYRIFENNPDVEKLNLVPTFGVPASDNLLATLPGTEIPHTPIGRLSVINAQELTDYYNKIVEYENAQAFSSPLIQDKAWMKNVIHVVGASDSILQGLLDNYMTKYRGIIRDTFYGGSVHTFSKSSADAVQQANNARIRALFEEGLGLITYFGHSSTTTLEFNLDNPSEYNNQGKYPLMITLGCNAGNFFNFNTTRFVSKETLSEKYTLAPNRGTIAFIASTHFGIVHYLDILNTRNYTAAATTKYGKSLGEIMIEGTTQVFNLTTTNDFYARFHCEQSTIHGDPSIKLNSSFAKPDYVIEDQLVKISPSFISVAETQFKVDAKFMNIGKAINKDIVVEVKRTYPDQSTEIVRRDTIPGIRYIDSLKYTFPILANRDKGINKLTFTVEADFQVDELYETNNSITKEFVIYEDEARPVYPYNLSIVNRQSIKLIASTANPFATMKQYKMELDTTELFNSSFKTTATVSGTGGIIEFLPGITFVDSMVYYWRVAPVPVTGQPVWNIASFVYLPASSYGFNQSHLYQHFKSTNDRMTLDSFDRKWHYKDIKTNLFVRNGVFPTACSQAACLSVAVNGDPYLRSVCGISGIIFHVFDPVTMKPWCNNCTGPYPGPGLFGSDAVCGATRQFNFQYNILDTNKRRKIVEFLDMIPDGHYVVIRNISGEDASTNTYASTWMGDTSYLGSGNSMYHRLKAQGFNDIDSFNRPRAFAFIYRKNRSNQFTPVSKFTEGTTDNLTLSADPTSPDTLAYMYSAKYGPARNWKEMKWRGSSEVSGDIATVDVIGIKQDGSTATLFTGLTTSQQDVDISSINATTYPWVQLKLRTQDSINFTPYQLKYWRVTYDPVPEGAIAPNLYLRTKDTLEVGEPLDFGLAFKNISDVAFDSLKVKMTITDKNNLTYIIPIPRKRPLPVNDTVNINATIQTNNIPGFNTLYVEANPDNDQLEQYHFNNFAYRTIYVKPDSLNPFLDVTFDGIHILNRDIVSSKPEILIKLKDDAKWAVLDDTSLLTVQVRYPNGTLRRFYFNNDTLRFTPAGQAPNPDNTATIDFNPVFPEDGEYELIVTGKDKSDNAAGNIEYRVAFVVINKPMISNMLNYPNPFTTSTAFVFTITGSEVPQNIKIEIMTITGKIVREITKNELGTLHIGRNITEFKWDGTDQYGQKLANGVYLYRVVTNLNGKMLDKYRSEADKTDKYFNNGYGKMVLIR